ncbi:hypothetical protein [Budvicia aquatica]|uniref:hypothetical protein n=1 Tax=Budvicia aquatica TaxID=82979 RepID=UPI000FD7F93B|nr:hypothetical protein [Budvicia aquatica]
MAGFLLSEIRTLHRTSLDDSPFRLALRANGKAVVQTPAALVRVRAPSFRETSLLAGFLLCEGWTLHRTSLDNSPFRLALRANGKAVVQTPAALVRVRAPLFRETSLVAGFLLSEIRTLHRTSNVLIM